MNTSNRRVGLTLGVLGTSIATLFGAAALSVPATALASIEAPAATTRAPRTTWHFENIPVRSALQLIAEEGGFNLVVADTVTGNVTLHLEDVTWEQVLDVVLKLKGLEQHVGGETRAIAAR
jgi:type IV pilus assembly protein PilQ